MPSASVDADVSMVHRPFTTLHDVWEPNWGQKYIERMNEYLHQNVNSKEGSYVVAEFFGFKKEWIQRMMKADLKESNMDRSYALLCMKNEMFRDTVEAPVPNLSFWEGQHRCVTNTTVTCNSAINFSTRTLRPPGEKRDWQPYINAGWIPQHDPTREDIATRTEDWIYGEHKIDHKFAMEIVYYRVSPEEKSSSELNAIVRTNSRNLRKIAQQRAYLQPLQAIGMFVKEDVENLSNDDIMADLEAPSTPIWKFPKGGLSLVKASDVNKKLSKANNDPRVAFKTYPVFDNPVMDKYMRTPNDPAVRNEFKELFAIPYKNENNEEKHYRPPFVPTLQALLTSEDKKSKHERLSLEMVNHFYYAPRIVHALMEPMMAQQDKDVTTDEGVFQLVEFMMLYVLSTDDRNQGKVSMHGAIKLYDSLAAIPTPTGENYLIGAATFLTLCVTDIFHRKVLGAYTLDPIRGKDGFYKAKPNKHVDDIREDITKRLQRFYDAIVTAKLMNPHRSLKEHLEAWCECFLFYQ